MIRCISFLVKVGHKLPWRCSKNWFTEISIEWKCILFEQKKSWFRSKQKIIQPESTLKACSSKIVKLCFLIPIWTRIFSFVFYATFCTYTNLALHDFPSRKRPQGSMLFWEYLVLKLKTLFFVHLVLQKKILLGSYL